MFRSAIMLVAAWAASPVAAESYAPRDECAAISGAAEFRTALADTVKRRDEQALLALVSEDVLLDFGGGSGHAELQARLHGESYQLWLELDAIMTLGCATEDGTILSMPWYFNQDMGALDPFEAHLVTGSRVALRAGPSLSSRVIKRLSWVPVMVDMNEDSGSGFVAVRQPGGPSGYVHKEYLRSFVDYRILAEQADGKWQITAFVAGD